MIEFDCTEVASGSDMAEPSAGVVWARRNQNDWRVAGYRLSDMKDFHFDEMSRSSPRFGWGYVDCSAIQHGDRLHPCRHNAKPHVIKIYVSRTDNETTFDEVVRSLTEACNSDACLPALSA